MSKMGVLVRIPIVAALLPFILIAYAADWYVKAWMKVDNFLCDRLPQ